MLQQGVDAQHGVVGLDNGGGDLAKQDARFVRLSVSTGSKSRFNRQQPLPKCTTATRTNLGARPDGGDLGLLAVVDGQTLQHQAAETGAGTTTDGVVDNEALQTSAVVGQLTDAVQAQVHDLLRMV